MNSSLVLRKRAKHCNTLNVHSANHEADIYAPCNPVPPHTLNIYPAQGVRSLETTALSRNPTRYPNSPIAVARQRSCRTQGSYHMVYATTLYCIILYYTILCYTIQYYPVLYFTIQYHTILQRPRVQGFELSLSIPEMSTLNHPKALGYRALGSGYLEP